MHLIDPLPAVPLSSKHLISLHTCLSIVMTTALGVSTALSRCASARQTKLLNLRICILPSFDELAFFRRLLLRMPRMPLSCYLFTYIRIHRVPHVSHSLHAEVIADQLTIKRKRGTGIRLAMVLAPFCISLL